MSSERMVGRRAEFDLLSSALHAVLDSDIDRRVPLLLIAGEAGIGKTRLLEELLDEARQFGAVVACGRCIQNGSEIRPLSAIVEILTDLAPVIDGAGVTRHRDLEPLVDANALSGLSAQSPAQLCEQVRRVLSELAVRQPVVVAVEDLHWADQTTGELLTTLVGARGLERVEFICTYRSDELHRRHPLLPVLAEFDRSARPERVDLEPLTEVDTTKLARAILGEGVTEATGRSLAQRSGGNPFYAEELLAAGVDHDRPPDSIRHVILARSQGLGPKAMRCIEAAAALAAPVDPTVLQATTTLDDEELRIAVDELCSERFLVESDAGLRFRHDLVREVFLDELLPGERTGLFARAAHSLQAHRPDRLGEIARMHFKAAQLPEALHSSVAAAESAAAIGAAAEASEHYGRALDIWDRVDHPTRTASVSRLHLLRRAARAADLARDFDLAVELGRLAVDEVKGVDPFEEGATLEEYCRYLWNATAPGIDDAVERALDVIPLSPPSIERARMEIRHAARRQFHGDVEGVESAFEQAADIASQVGACGVEADARSMIAHNRAVLGDEKALSAMREALELAASVDDGWIVTKINVNLTNALVFLGQFEQVFDIYDAGIEVAERHGLMSLTGILLQGNTLEALEALGRWGEALAIMNEIRRRHDADSLDRWASAFVGWAQIEINRGNHAAAAPTFVRALEISESGYYGGDLAQIGTGLIEVASAGAAPTVDTDTVDSLLDRIPPDEASMAARLVATAARHLVPPRAAGRDQHQEAILAVDRWIGAIQRTADEYFVRVPPMLEAWLDQARVELAETNREPVVARWAQIASDWDELRCPFFAAVARYRHANSLLLATGGRSAADRGNAKDLLTSARQIAVDLEAEPLLHDIEDLAQRARIRLDDRTPSEPSEPSKAALFGLTPREFEVLRLVTKGRSNGEIGTALFISTKTASVHVSNILRKLSAANRIEAAAIARQHDL